MEKSVAVQNITRVVILALITWMASVLLLWGCGKKAMPEPPSGRRPPKVKDLKYSISENVMKLSWTIPKTSTKARLPIAGFFIYRSKQLGIDADCPNCPIHYQKIGEVLVRRGAPGQPDPPLVYTQTVEPGYRYVYKVIAYDEDGITGRDSNLVDFMY